VIPAHLVNSGSVIRLMDYCVQELQRAKSARQPLERVWMQYHEAYRALPKGESNNFPFPNSSNLVIPIVATDVDTIYSRLMGMYFASESLWVARATRPDMVDFAPRLEEFLGWAQENELRIYDPISNWLLETVKLGTGVLKTRYTREYRKVYEFREIGMADGSVQTLERQARVLMKDRPDVAHVPLWNFYVPAGYSDLQAMPWCAERIPLNWNQLLNRAKHGIYTGLERLGQHWGNSKGHTIEQNLDRMDRYVPQNGDKFEIFEFWLDWDIDADGEDEAIVVTIHPETRTFLRIDFNPFFNQEKPYDFSRYFRIENRFYGIGVAEMLKVFQDEVSTMHNQRLDSYSVSNAALFVALKTGNIKQDEPLWPGRILLVDSLDEIKPLQLGSPLGQDIGQERMTLEYGRQRTGVNDWVAGHDSPGSNYATATAAVQQLREGAKRIDQTLRENRRCLSNVGLRVAELYQQFNQGGKPYLAMGEKDGALVEQVLRFPMEIIRAGVAIDVRATSASQNKEVEIRTNMMIMQQVTQYYMQLLQAMQLMLNPQLPPQIQRAAYDAVVGGSIMMRRILDTHGMQDVDRIVPDIQEILNAGQQQIGALTGALGGGAPMGQGFGQPPGVPALPAGAPGAAGPQFGGFAQYGQPA
jgi:hypothetical protein